MALLGHRTSTRAWADGGICTRAVTCASSGAIRGRSATRAAAASSIAALHAARDIGGGMKQRVRHAAVRAKTCPAGLRPAGLKRRRRAEPRLRRLQHVRRHLRGGGMTIVFGHTTICTPKTCSQAGLQCGNDGDGWRAARPRLRPPPVRAASSLCCGGGHAACAGTRPARRNVRSARANCGPFAPAAAGSSCAGSARAPKTSAAPRTARLVRHPGHVHQLCLKQVTSPTPR